MPSFMNIGEREVDELVWTLDRWTDTQTDRIRDIHVDWQGMLELVHACQYLWLHKSAIKYEYSEWVSEQSLTPHPTQYRSFRRRSLQPITWLILRNKAVQENKQVLTVQVQVQVHTQTKCSFSRKTQVSRFPVFHTRGFTASRSFYKLDALPVTNQQWQSIEGW